MMKPNLLRNVVGFSINAECFTPTALSCGHRMGCRVLRSCPNWVYHERRRVVWPCKQVQVFLLSLRFSLLRGWNCRRRRCGGVVSSWCILQGSSSCPCTTKKENTSTCAGAAFGRFIACVTAGVEVFNSAYTIRVRTMFNLERDA